MAMEWFEKFIDALKSLLKEPPYLPFLFIGAILVIVSTLFNRYYEQAQSFFLYSVIGMIWRYAEKDIHNNVGKKEWQRAVVILIYHVGNIALFLFLLRHLGLI